MTIAAVGGQGGGATAAAAGSISRAFSGNVSAGSLLIIIGTRYDTSSLPFSAGNCTKSAGTAVIGTITLDKTLNLDIGGGAHENVGIWSVIVTSAGSCTMQVAGGDAGSYPNIGMHEFTGNWGASRVEATSSSSTATDGTSSAVTGNGVSAGAALFIAGLSADITLSNNSMTPEAAFTQIFEEEAGDANNSCSCIYRIVSTGTTDQGEWTFSATNSNGWVNALAIYKETAAGIVPVLMRQYRARRQ